MISKLVSIVVPTYNRASLLKEAIESVLAQKYENFELLVLDNCSPDDTPDVVISFKDPRIKYIRHQCNIGSAANWTYGVHWTQGEYLSILGDDDKYKPNFISNRIRAFSVANDVVAVFSPYDICDEDGDIRGSSSIYGTESTLVRNGEFVKCAAQGFWSIGTGLYNREIVLRYWDRALRGGSSGDTALNLSISILSHGSGVWIPERDYIYRLHDGQDTARLKERLLFSCIQTHELAMADGCPAKYRHMLRDSMAWANHVIGRMAWEQGQHKNACRYFLKEIILNPVRFFNWLINSRKIVMARLFGTQ